MPNVRVDHHLVVQTVERQTPWSTLIWDKHLTAFEQPDPDVKSLLIYLNLCAQSSFQCIIKSTIRDFKKLLKRHFGAYKTQRYSRKLESSRITVVCILIFIEKKMVRSFGKSRFKFGLETRVLNFQSNLKIVFLCLFSHDRTFLSANVERR